MAIKMKRKEEIQNNRRVRIQLGNGGERGIGRMRRTPKRQTW